MVFLLFIAGLSAMSVFKIPYSPRVFVVQSGSMTPTIKLGSLIFVFPSSQYQKGDIITAKLRPESNIKHPYSTVTHRIVDVEEKDDSIFYITKGDANTTPDFDKRPSDLVLGKVVYIVPFLGYPVGFAKTQTGFIFLIAIPAVIIVYSEFLNIKKEFLKIIKKKKHVSKN